MTIKDTPNILVDGQNVYPYSVDFNYGGSEKGSITIKYVNRDGVYSVPDLDSEKPVKIKIGNFATIDGYVVETEYSQETNGGIIQTVSYDDSSIILDKIVIGLKGINGPGFNTESTGSFNGVILIGSQLDPCEGMENLPVDPCAPLCEEKNNERDSFDCNKEKRLKILQVDYNFNDLRAALAAKVNIGSFPVAVNLDYRASYTGTLREVLQSWCSDFGLGFYWDSNAVYFYDLSVGIPVNTAGIENGNSIIRYTENKSIRNNVSKIKSVYFGMEGEEREYSCSANSSKALEMKAITLFDLISDTARPGGTSSPAYSYLRDRYDPKNKNMANAVSNFYDSVVLSYYSDKLRDLYFLYEREGITSPTKMEEWIAANPSRTIPALGDLKPKKVLHKNSTDSKIQELWTKAKAHLDLTPNDAALFEERGGYFVIASYNEIKHQSLSDMEKSLAENFMGKYWIRPFSAGNDYTYDAPDGNVMFYSNGSEIQFPFLNDLPDDIKRASDFLQDLIQASVADGEGVISDQKFLLLERTPIWSPSRKSTVMEKFLATVTPFQIVNLGQPDIDGLNYLGSDTEDIYSNSDFIFQVFTKPKKLDLNILGGSKEEINPLDAKNTGKRTEFLGLLTSYGLNSALSRSYTVKAPGSTVKINIPSQSGDRFGSEYGGYTILANGTNFTNNFTVELGKKQSVLGDSTTQTNKDVSAQLVFKDATQNLLKYLEASGTQSCGYNSAAINALLLKFNSRQKTFPNSERIVKTYDISGIPETKFTLRDGLQNFSITFGENGIHSSISFANLPIQNKSEALEEKRFEKIAAILGKPKNYFRQ